MTKTRIAKKAVHAVVALNVAAVVEAKVSQYFDIEDESITLDVGSFVIGQLVANQTDKLTDPMVEKTATFLRRKLFGTDEDTAEIAE